MKDEEILKGAIKKAINYGYKPAWWLCEFNIINPKDNGLYFSKNVYFKEAQELLKWHRETFNNRPAILGIYPTMNCFYQIIFSHNFAKAFWGEDWFDSGDRCSVCNGTNFKCGDDSDHLRAWEFHLQQMVLEKEPLKYLEKFL